MMSESFLSPKPSFWKTKAFVQEEFTSERRIFLSTEIVGAREIGFALAAVFVSAGIFLAAVPFASLPLAYIPAFIPAYESAMVICDLITCVLLFSQFMVLRSWAMFALASGYLFTAITACAHALTFPGVFSPTGLLGAGPQTTIWLYLGWHIAFPLFVIVYALLKGDSSQSVPVRGMQPPSRKIAAACGIAAVVALALAYISFATVFQRLLPVFIQDDTFTRSYTAVVCGCCALCFVALTVVWWLRARTVLDLWLMVVMCAWLFDIALCGVFNNGRFDLGWYAGRIYGLLTAGALLIVLLIENGAHYVRLAQLSVALGVANKSLEKLSLRDGLSNIANRRHFDSYLASQIAVARRQKKPLALVLCDIDCFKNYNDHYGHPAGDECLKHVADALQSSCRRPADMAARYGGEEFALILPDTDMAGAVRIAEVARDSVAQLCIPHAYSPAASHVTISGGVAVLLIGATAEQLIAAADESLFRAKHQGRNRMLSVLPEPKPEYV